MIKELSWKKCRKLIREDAARNGRLFLMPFRPKHALLFWFRLCSYFNVNRFRFLHLITKVNFKILQYFTGVHMDESCEIEGGIHLEHHFNIAISVGSKIGKNLTIFQGVTIGKNFGGKHYGYPTIGNNVILFAGCKVLGNIKIGNNVIVGANSVVTHDVPDNCVVAGTPAKIISSDFITAIIQSEYEKHFHLSGY